MTFVTPVIATLCTFSLVHQAKSVNLLDALVKVKAVVDTVKDRIHHFVGLISGCAEPHQYGCDQDKGRCWSYCICASPFANAVGAFGKEWCWTTQGSSLDGNYVQCYSRSDCDPCWKCAGPCMGNDWIGIKEVH